SARRDTDDRGRAPVHLDVTADRRPVAAEPALPRRVSEHDNGVRPGGWHIVGADGAAEHRVDVEERKVLTGHPGDQYALGWASLGGEAGEARAVARGVFENVAAGRAIVLEVWERHAVE